MPKQKQFLTARKRSKHAAMVPETADEYLAAGVELEEAGEKWRGGDAEKSTRFFVRAIECYDEALKKFPRSFDLAYNKARVQYELTQHPKLLNQLPRSLTDLLNDALDSSKYALSLNGENADVLFNTAQIFTSLSENSADLAEGLGPLHLTQEALRLFQQCLEVQEKQAQASAAEAEEADSTFVAANSSQSQDTIDTEQGGVSLAVESSIDVGEDKEPVKDERWAIIVEPVTNDVLLDTALAQLEALTQMCGLIVDDHQDAILWIQTYAKDLIQTKLRAFTIGTNRSIEANIARAAFVSALTNLQFQAHILSAKIYADQISTAYDFEMSNSAEGLCGFAEALMTFNTTVRFVSNDPKTLDYRWTALSVALKHLTSASKINGADNLAKIHIARGDVEISRFQLGQSGWAHKSAVDNRDTLLRNAGKFYVGAKGLAAANGWKEEGFEATLKSYVVQGLLGDGAALKAALEGTAKSQNLLADMVDEGLVTTEQLASMNTGTRS
ncbi:unnamed protein product [Diplocarpon coronariae]|uniref:Uncharacterized protein n=1 Tax=Diplocarpon coronariae TaxID=2795749 RepID=A0A218Z803_9HELO|nr:hypothetical protein JHW43_001177 [Diplocarpon mali]OWP03306.1 hypothetical protein B2J93_7324 [Marssonina coronariae]